MKGIISVLNTIQNRDKILGLISWTASLATFLILGILLFDMISDGFKAMSFEFFLNAPEKAGRAGGIAPILISTMLVVGIAIAVSMPIGLATALLLSEFTRTDSQFAFFVRKSLDILAGVPSIVFGLFGNAFFCVYLGMGFSILSGGLTLACMVLPILIRTTEESFRAVPNEFRHGIAALGFTKTASVFHLLMPMALPGLIVGTILGIGRATAETAALIFTSGYVDRMPESVFDSGRTLSVHIYDLAMNIPGGDRMAYATSLCLVLILLCMSVLTNFIAKSVLQRGINIS